MEQSSLNIDFVIPWVDGSDPEWLKEKNAYASNAYQDARNIRFRDWDLLRYWFRGVEKYAPWVNRIHFITRGHLPSWLDTNNTKIHIVNHRDYIPEGYLPTFSSHVIELNMHRIEGLSEHFVYFNDDVFLINAVKQKDFFVNGFPCDCMVESAITPRIGEFSSILCETLGVINNHFTKEDLRAQGLKKYFNPRYKELLIRTLSTMPYHHIMGFYNHHICQAYNKSTLVEVWNSEQEILNKTCHNKFRSQSDVNQYLFRFWNLCKGNFEPRYPIGKSIRLSDDVANACRVIKGAKWHVVTLNDAVDVKDMVCCRDKLKQAFSTKLSNKSLFEI